MSLRRFFPSVSSNNSADNLPYQDFANNQNNGFFQLVMDPTANRYNEVVSAIQDLGYSGTSEGCDNPTSVAHVDCYQSSTECPQALNDQGCGTQTTPVDVFRCSNAGQSNSYDDVVNGINGACAAPASSGDGLSALALGLIVGVPVGIIVLTLLACYLKSICSNRQRPGLFNHSANQADLNQALAAGNQAPADPVNEDPEEQKTLTNR